jgi:hypothetical protein
MGYRTFEPKRCPVSFVIKNIAPKRKTIKVFLTPIKNGQEYDLMNIPAVSEAVIKHSLLKGELMTKIKAGEIHIEESSIDLLQFDDCQKQFLIDAGVVKGVDPDTLGGGGGANLNFAFKQGQDLIGTLDGNNRVFTTSEKFINGTWGNNIFKILIKHNGRDLVEGIDYMISESGGVGSGYDTVIFTFSPTSTSILSTDYVVKI